MENIEYKPIKRIRYAVFTFYFAQGLCFSSWASRIPDIKSYFNLDDAAWGNILFMIPIGQLIGMAFSGFMVAKFGSKKILLVALPLYVSALLLIGASSYLYMLIMSLILFGLFGNFCNISVNTQGVNVENIYDKPIMSSFHGGWSLAGFTGSLIGFFMIYFDIKPLYNYIFMAILVFILIIFNYKYLQIDNRRIISVKSEEKIGEYIEKNNVRNIETKNSKPEKFLFYLGIVGFCGMAAEGAMFDWSGLYFQEVVKVPKNLITLGFTAFMIMMASGRFIADSMIHKYGRRKVVQTAGILISLGLFLSVIYPHIIVTTIAFMIIGLGVSSVIPTIYSLAGQKTKISVGIALTIVSSISFLGFLLGPPVIGYISHIKNLRYSYALIGIFGICIFAFSSKMKVFKD